MTAEPRTFVYAAIGPVLTCHALDLETATLTPGASIHLPSNVQYAWPHRSGRTLYVACSDGSAALGITGQSHFLTALRIDPATGALAPHGAPVQLPARPIHLTLDPASEHALAAFNAPAAVQVYRIAADDTLGAEVEQDAPLEFGIFPHQVRVTRDGKRALVAARGHDATGDRPEQPGSLHVFDYAGGRLSHHHCVAPGGGYGFGPRHLDFHPSAPWVYVALERQNELAAFRWMPDGLEPEPRCRISTLAAGPTGVHQMAAAIKVHPSGRSLYVSNRSPEVRGGGAQPRFTGGDNTIAVYAIDPVTGMPTPLEHVESGGMHCRNLTITGNGTILVASHVAGFEVAGTATFVAAGLSVFRIGLDGRLTLQQRYSCKTGEEQLFWSGAVTIPMA